MTALEFPGRRSAGVAISVLAVLAVLFTVLLGRVIGIPLDVSIVLVSVAGIAVAVGLRHPAAAVGYLLLFTFLRLAIPPGTFLVDPFLPAFVGVLVAAYAWPAAKPAPRPGVDGVSLAMGLYVLWVLISALTPHKYPAGSPLSGESFSVPRFVLIGIVIPLVMYLVGRNVFVTEARVRGLLWMAVAFGGYSALVSILQFTGPKALVWPRYIVDDPNWSDRAVGVFNQPVVNGLALVVGFLCAVLLASEGGYRLRMRGVLLITAAITAWGVYLTHTRAAYVSLIAVALLGLASRGRQRRYFFVTLAVIAVGATATWGTLTSADRSAGGVASPDEVEDRLNGIATSLWAAQERPVAGWGIGRFAAVNTYHHQAWSTDVPWERGYGITSHLDALGTLVELGIIGLVLWSVVITLVAMSIWRSLRCLPLRGVAGRPFAEVAALSLVALIVTSLTVDLRFFDYPNIIVMVLAGSAVGRARSEGDQHYVVARRTRVAA